MSFAFILRTFAKLIEAELPTPFMISIACCRVLVFRLHSENY